ncbi:hypothetical protein DL93DRAFT_2087426 [Clavulina sp. PMI_390]|nr:hypothetical protein DL93DRAFT_2087426 [Clavulina sp. PMI_390]
MTDLFAATISPEPRPPTTYIAGKRPNNQQDVLESHKVNSESLLVVGDSSGYLHFLMDGHYSLGTYNIDISCQPLSIYALPDPPYNPNIEMPPELQLFLTAQIGGAPPNHYQSTNTRALNLKLPLLRLPWTRQLARSSTTLRALLLYSNATIREMRDSWWGSDTREPARNLGRKWVTHLEQLSSNHGDCKQLPSSIILAGQQLTDVGKY